MDWINELLRILNDNAGVTLILSALGFGFNEWVKTRNASKIDRLKFKAENIDIKALEKENELYLIFSNFCLSDDFSEENCIAIYEKIRGHIIDNDLFLREKLSKVGGKFADYIIEDVSKGLKDLHKEEALLKEFKKLYRA
ncbi:hypothetical protein [Flavivirga jejuensis]|uniref:Uncharacterized protein n=1 Tax=Flavivirga jejuensis TaxID=870487 RepID=A0ABT8WMQ6_9FLAO|nr:hypothetical protein [Flavivirga jejuensis]MDO5974444.1 hypothetical protein [Flavivirga jejuensis]